MRRKLLLVGVKINKLNRGFSSKFQERYPDQQAPKKKTREHIGQNDVIITAKISPTINKDNSYSINLERKYSNI